MKARFHPGQRVRIARTEELCDATIGAFATIDSYAGPNHDGTDWSVHLTPEIAEPEGAEPFWILDEGSLVPVDDKPPVPPEEREYCLDAEGTRLDCVYTRWIVRGLHDRDRRLAGAAALLSPLIGGSPHSTDFVEYPLRERPKEFLGLFTRWCGCDSTADIVVAWRERFPESREIRDDGWAVELYLRAEDAVALFGPATCEFHLEIEPWSSFERRTVRYD